MAVKIMTRLIFLKFVQDVGVVLLFSFADNFLNFFLQ